MHERITVHTDVQKVGDNINVEVIRILRLFDLYDIIDKLVLVADGQNAVVALHQVTRLSYSAYILNTVLEHMIQEESGEESCDLEGLMCFY
jgi:hypothetical protein